MNKIFKDEKIFNDFKKQFKEIFQNQSFINLTQNHFNKNGSFAAFTLAFLQNRVSESKIAESVRINTDEWLDLFSALYNNNEIKKAYDLLDLNPLILLEKIIETFTCFNDFANKLWSYILQQGWDINISKADFNELICSAFGYLMYNEIDCKLNRELSDVLQDKDYDKKYTMVLNNTKLFANAKSCILKHCELKVNDLIVILLGGSHHLALDK